MNLPPLVRRKDIEYAPRRVVWFTAGGNSRDGYEVDIKIGGSEKSREAYSRRMLAIEEMELACRHLTEALDFNSPQAYTMACHGARKAIALIDAPASAVDEPEPE